MEVEGSSKGPQRLILRCSDDEGNFMCFICGDYAPSAKTLYHHLKTSSCNYRWRSVLPKKLFDCSTVVVRHTLLMTVPHSHSSIKLKEEGECSSSSRSGGDSTTRFLSEWNGNGKRRSKRARQDDNDGTKEEAPNSPNKAKVVADAPDDTDRVVAEAVGKVVLDFDLNEPPMMEQLPDDDQ